MKKLTREELDRSILEVLEGEESPKTGQGSNVLQNLVDKAKLKVKGKSAEGEGEG